MEVRQQPKSLKVGATYAPPCCQCCPDGQDSGVLEPGRGHQGVMEMDTCEAGSLECARDPLGGPAPCDCLAGVPEHVAEAHLEHAHVGHLDPGGGESAVMQSGSPCGSDPGHCKCIREVLEATQGDVDLVDSGIKCPDLLGRYSHVVGNLDPEIDGHGDLVLDYCQQEEEEEEEDLVMEATSAKVLVQDCSQKGIPDLDEQDLVPLVSESRCSRDVESDWTCLSGVTPDGQEAPALEQRQGCLGLSGQFIERSNEGQVLDFGGAGLKQRDLYGEEVDDLELNQKFLGGLDHYRDDCRNVLPIRGRPGVPEPDGQEADKLEPFRCEANLYPEPLPAIIEEGGLRGPGDGCPAPEDPYGQQGSGKIRPVPSPVAAIFPHTLCVALALLVSAYPCAPSLLLLLAALWAQGGDFQDVLLALEGVLVGLGVTYTLLHSIFLLSGASFLLLAKVAGAVGVVGLSASRGRLYVPVILLASYLLASPWLFLPLYLLGALARHSLKGLPRRARRFWLLALLRLPRPAFRLLQRLGLVSERGLFRLFPKTNKGGFRSRIPVLSRQRQPPLPWHRKAAAFLARPVCSLNKLLTEVICAQLPPSALRCLKGLHVLREERPSRIPRLVERAARPPGHSVDSARRLSQRSRRQTSQSARKPWR